MAYRDDEDEADDGAELDEREDPEPSDIDDDDDAETIPCPYCGKDVYEQAELCPHCGSYLSREDAPPTRLRWAVAVIVAFLVIALIWILVAYV